MCLVDGAQRRASPRAGEGRAATLPRAVRSGPERRPEGPGRVQAGDVGVSETGTVIAGCSSRGSARIAHQTTMQRYTIGILSRTSMKTASQTMSTSSVRNRVAAKGEKGGRSSRNE